MLISRQSVIKKAKSTCPVINRVSKRYQSGLIMF